MSQPLPSSSPSDNPPKERLRALLKQGPYPGGFDDVEAWLRVWFEPLSLRRDQEILHVAFPHELFAAWFEQHGRDALERAARQAWGPAIRLQYSTGGKPSPATSSSFSSRDIFPVASRPFFSATPGTAAEQGFENFFCGGKNQFPLSILRETVEGARVYTPLLLRGASGTGKTHLLRAAAATLAAKDKEGGIWFLTAPDFAALIHGPEWQKVRRTFMSCAALCVDDVHLLAGHPAPQEELAALIDVLAPRACPVLCAAASASDAFRPASGHEDDDPMTSLAPGLLSRLCMGMVLELAEPDLDVRLRYAQAQMAERGLAPGKEMALFLARRCGGLRRLHGVILRIDAFRAQTGRLPDESDLDTILRSTGNPSSLTPDAVLALVASRCGYTSKDLRGRKRDPKLVRARQIAMYLCRELLGESYPALGRMFGGKDHSTVMHAVKKIRENQVTNKDVHILVTELTQSCRKHLP